MAASRNLLGQVGEGYARTPSGYTVSAHAAERIVYGAPGRSPTTVSRVDDILNGWSPMTETLSSVGSMPKDAMKRSRSSSRATPGERAAVAELVKAARARGDDITGPEGLLKSITATVLETALEEEITDHLGHARPGTG